MSSKRKRDSEHDGKLGMEFLPTMRATSEALSGGPDGNARVALMVERAAKLLEHNYYDAALQETKKVLQLLHKETYFALSQQSDMAYASVLRGTALLKPLQDKLAYQGEEEDILIRTLREAYAAFAFALVLNPGSSQAKTKVNEIKSLAVELFGSDGLSAEVAMPTLATVEANMSEALSSAGCKVEAEDSAGGVSDTGCDSNEETGCDRCAYHDIPDHHKAANVDFDVIIVGAGACGVGIGMALIGLFGVRRERMLLLERSAHVGASFRLWPKEMRFISPSFNQQGWTSSFDLNSIAHGTSPATFTLEEHPTGEQYAQYLEAVANDASLPIRFGTEVTKVCPVGLPGDPRFEVHHKSCDNQQHQGAPPSPRECILKCRFVIWAAGEFQYPKPAGSIFPGSDLCCHNSTVRSWSAHPGKEFIVIGGYESGIDAAVNLVSTDRRVTVLASSPCWEEASRDPSAELSPHTRSRLKVVTSSHHAERLQLKGGLRVTQVERDGDRYLVHTLRKESALQGPDQEAAVLPKSFHEDVSLAAGPMRIFRTQCPPILCVGFEGSVAHLVKDLFEWEQPGASTHGTDAGEASTKSGPLVPSLTEEDESTKTEGLFLAGPQVSHEGLVFCFVYKFRQRFAVVAAAVAERLGKDPHMGVLTCRGADMYLDDFAGIHACCGEPVQ